MLSECRLCPRACGADRARDRTGRCGAGARVRVAFAGLHAWEEPPLSGQGGAGAVFFGGCPLGCVYCQNSRISRGGAGRATDSGELAETFLQLQAAGAQNLDLVTGTPYVPQIAEAIKRARARGLRLPVVWNTSGYETPETLAALCGTVDIYLTDFKYWADDLAERYSAAPGYRRTAKLALKEMVHQQPTCMTGPDGAMTRGVIVRHLVLPGCREDSERILQYLGRTWSRAVWVSLMRQYTPTGDLADYPELQHRISDSAYERLCHLAERCGFERLFVQERGCASLDYVPDFSG